MLDNSASVEITNLHIIQFQSKYQAERVKGISDFSLLYINLAYLSVSLSVYRAQIFCGTSRDLPPSKFDF